MSRTTDDLRAVLAAHADDATHGATDRLAGVHARVRRTRQVRAAAAAGTLAVLVAGAATVALGGFLPSQEAGQPADPAPRMPSTYLGRTLVTSTSVEASGAAGGKDWTVGVPPSLRQALVARCEGVAGGPDAEPATVRLGARSFDVPCDGSAHTLAAGARLTVSASGADETVSAVRLGPGPVPVSASGPAGTAGPDVVTLGLYEGDLTPLAEEGPPFADTDLQLAVVDIGSTVLDGTAGIENLRAGHLFASVECQDDPSVDQTRYGVRWTVPGAAGPTVLSCLRNGEVNRLEDTSTTFTAGQPGREVAYEVVEKDPVTQQWGPAARRGAAFQARLVLWITKGVQPPPTS